MSLESATWATQLDSSNPLSTDPRSQGDDHLRLTKSVLKNELSPVNREWVYTGHSVVWRASNRFTTTADTSTVYKKGRLVKVAGSSTYQGVVTDVTYSATTAITVGLNGSLANETLQTYVSTSVPKIVYFEDFGAVGDGATDDSAAINFALAAYPYVKAFPGRTYLIGSGLSVPANTTLDLTGAFLIFSATITAITLAGSNGKVIGGTITGPAGTYLVNSKGIVAAGTTNGAGVAPTRLTGIRIHDVKIDKVGDYGIDLSYLSDCIVTGCEVTNAGYTGIGVYSCNDTKVNNNIVDTLAGETTSGELNAYGIFFSAANDADTTQYPICDSCEAHHNIIKNVPNWHGIGIKGGTYISACFNEIHDCRRGIVISNTGTTATTDSTVAFNTIRNTLARTNNAVSFNQQSEALWDIGVNASTQNARNRLEYNSVYQHGGGIGRSAAAFIQYAKNGSCSHNVFMEPWLAGVIVSTSVDNYVLDSNTVIDPKSEGTGASPAMFSNVPRGFDFSDEQMDNIQVTNNAVILRDSTVSTYVGDVGMLVNNTANKSIYFEGNRFVELSTINFSLGADLTGLTGDIAYAFTGTLTGYATPPTGSVSSKVRDGVVTLSFPTISGTSNSTALTMTGLPAWLTPGADRIAFMRGQDNSTADVVVARVDSGSATITFFYTAAAASWTASGTKGILQSTITYSL